MDAAVPSMRFALFLLFFVPAVGLLIAWLVKTAKTYHQLGVRQRQALQEASRHPTPDAQARAEFARRAGSSRGMAFLLAVGWIAMFTGIGIAAIGGITNCDEAIGGGVLTSIIGFGFVTYPFALRELEGRAGRPETQRRMP